MWLLVALLLSQGPPSFAPDDSEGLVVSPNPKIRHAWKRKVFWRSSMESAPAAYRAEQQQMTQTLDRLTAILKATPTGSTGQGFWVNEARTLGFVDASAAPPGTAAGKIPLEFHVGLFPFYHEDILDNGQWRLSVRGETESIYYHFNKLPGSLQQPVVAREGQTEFYLRPRITGNVQGIPLYEKTALVLTGGGRDPWQAVALGRALKAAMPAYEKDRQTAIDRLNSYKAKNAEVQAPAYEQQMRERFEKNNGSLRTTRPSNYEARFRSMEHELKYNRERAAAEANPERGDAKGDWYWNPILAHEEASKRLASLSAAEAAQPACFIPAKNTNGRYTMVGDLSSGADPNCREIVQTNLNYFDFSLPRSKAQILMIGNFGRCAALEGDRIVSAPVRRFDHPAQGCVQHAQMWREADWTKFASLIQ